jgi:hypothetical protein
MLVDSLKKVLRYQGPAGNIAFLEGDDLLRLLAEGLSVIKRKNSLISWWHAV